MPVVPEDNENEEAAEFKWRSYKGIMSALDLAAARVTERRRDEGKKGVVSRNEMLTWCCEAGLVQHWKERGYPMRELDDLGIRTKK